MLAAHLLYLQGILEFAQINFVYWTLCLEVQFYSIFCFLMVLVSRFRRDESDPKIDPCDFCPGGRLAAAWPLRVIPSNPWPGLFSRLVARSPDRRGCVLGDEIVIPLWWFDAYSAPLGLGEIWYFDSTVLICVLLQCY